ncbi:MAG TPA: methyltransferase domain-containing protein, partial [Thermoanaerobaculia bacterium]|nr:methyltransferase domain-containing protein [Thermoanaerobaculia bacterium]
FTEIVPVFARRGERAARAAASPATAVETGRLDMTKPWADQGVPAGTFDAVYSVNCFHVAPDLGFVLREAKAALRPGGAVVVSECIRPATAAGPIWVEFVFGFLESFNDVRTDPVLRPSPGFLTSDAWRRSFVAAGYPVVEVVPDVDRLAREYPGFVVGAVVARAG